MTIVFFAYDSTDQKPLLENLFNFLKPLLLHSFERFFAYSFLFVLFFYTDIHLSYLLLGFIKILRYNVMESSYPTSFEYSLTIFANCYTFSRFPVYLVAVITRSNPTYFHISAFPFQLTIIMIYSTFKTFTKLCCT